MTTHPPAPTLAELLGDDHVASSAAATLPVASSPSLATRSPAGVCLDSRELETGDLYLAVGGASTHGFRFAADVLQRGALAVAVDPADIALFDDDLARTYRVLLASGAPLIEVPGLARRAPAVAARFHGHPDRALTLIAVTGTDGKTSVCRFVAAALEALGTPCGYIGTIGWGRGDALVPTALTTPDAVTLPRLLAALRDGGARAVALEASSHALAGRRLDALELDVAVLTNLGRDHLDFHGDVDRYRAAKARLFGFADLSAIVVNGDDAFGRDLAVTDASRSAAAPVCGAAAPTTIVYTVERDRAGAGSADGGRDVVTHDDDVVRVRARDVSTAAGGLAFTLLDGPCRTRVESPLMGRFNVANLLATHGVLRALGHESESVAGVLGTIRPPAGRMERFVARGRPTVVVDYAHTPQALEAAIAALHAHCAGALWVVFGCGGDRDTGKRAPMGRAAEAAGHVVVTDDNPRGEASADIIAMILDGMVEPARATVIPDRHAAIAHAVRSAAAEDVVLVAGKGHEDYQIVGDVRLSLSDRVCVEALLAEDFRCCG